MNISGFDNLEQIGESAKAAVWKAHQVSLERDVAIKVLKEHITSNVDELAIMIGRAKSAASLKHPNIIPIFDAAEEDGVYYFVMEYIAGPTVAQEIEKGPVSWKKVAQTGLAIAEALDLAWNEVKLHHGGINTSNIMFDDDGTVKLADLGLAMRLDAGSIAAQIESGQFEIRPNYLSPEQASCKISCDFRADMYALGATMYNMVTGHAPFEQHSPSQVLEMQVSGQITNPRDIIPGIPIGLCQLITKLMMKSPADRYPSWTEAAKDFKKVITGRVIAVSQANSTVSPSINKASDNANEKEMPSDVATQPRWITALAWSVLLAWGIYIAMSICQLPPVPALPKPVPYQAPKTRVTANTAPHKEPDVTEKTKHSAEPDQEESGDKAKTAASPKTDSKEAQELYNSMKLKLTDFLIADNYSDAMTCIAQEKMYASSPQILAEVAKMEECINTISKRDVALEEALNKKIGQEITINIRGGNWPVIIRSIEDKVIKLDLKSKVGSETRLRPATLTFNQISASECLRLSGAPDSEAKFVTLFLTYIKAKDYQSALKAAEKCGPFADAFKSKIAREMAPPAASSSNNTDNE